METTARGGELDGSVGNSSNDYKNSVGDLSVYRRGVKYLATMLFLLPFFAGGCSTTPTSTAYRQSFGNAVIGETVGRIINPNAYKPEQREETQSSGGDYFIVVNKATGESKRIEGSHGQLYEKIIETKKADEYPEGYIMYVYQREIGPNPIIVNWTPK